MSNEQQKKHDFVCDLESLSKDYGWTIDEAMEIIGFESKKQYQESCDSLMEFTKKNFSRKINDKN